MRYRLESQYALKSDWLPDKAFTRTFLDIADAISTAIEGTEDPLECPVRVVCVETGEVVWDSAKEKFEEEDPWRLG